MEQNGEIILYQPDATMQLEVRLENESVWLTQAQMATLFGTQRQAVTKHIKNIYDSGELEREATCSILELVRNISSCRKICDNSNVMPRISCHAVIIN